jgi:adenylylsulfate kinase
MAAMKKILIMGPPGAGKTTLANALKPLLRAVHFNADEVRASLNRDLGFSLQDRIEQARRMGWLCDQVVRAGHYAIADFVCPTRETRAAFGSCFLVHVAAEGNHRYADTDALFEAPTAPDFLVPTKDAGPYAVEIAKRLSGAQIGFDWRRPTALFVGRYQPFHDGHKALILEGLRRVGQACVAVRDTEGIDDSNPFSFADVRARIEAGLAEHLARIAVIHIPNISNVFYGRDVGYGIERINLPADVERISATQIRQTLSPQS